MNGLPPLLFRTGAQWWEIPAEFGAWSTVHNRFRQGRDAGVFETLLEGLIAEAGKRGRVDLSLVSVDSTTTRAHHDAAGMDLDPNVLDGLEEAAAQAERARSKGAARRNKVDRTTTQSRAQTRPALAHAPPEGRLAGPLARRADQQDPRRG